MTDLTKKLESLSPEKRELLLKKLRAKNLTNSLNSGHQDIAIAPVTRTGLIPLSFAQERLWFLDQLEGGQSSAYNMGSAIEIAGNLNREAVRKAFQALIERHEILRTAIVTEEGQPQQAINLEPHWQIQEIDLRQLEPESQAGQVRELIGQEAATPFDLSQSPLMRVQLLRLAAERHILQITLHHIISDGWSMEVLVREWSGLYRALAQGQPSPLAPLTIQYADFAVWQRRWLQGEVLQKQLDYWKKQLEDAPPLLELPTDHPRPAVQTFRGQTRDFYLSGELTEKLRALAQKAGATLFMTLLAALAILLSRYSRQGDIVIGSPIANRHRQELEPLIGFFVNTLALRVRLADNPSFEELLGQVRQTTLEAYSHQDLPFEKLVEELQVERSLSHSPLFQVMFVLQNAPTTKLEFEGLQMTVLEADNLTAKFDLTVSVEETERGLRGKWEYNRDLFEPETIERMGNHFQNLLEGIVANPQAQVFYLPLLSPSERHQLLVEWNDTAKDYPQDKCFHHLFEEQVAKTPDAVALVYGEKSLTYRQLNERANQLAHYLQRLGVYPEMLVGICLERSLEMVIGLLGVLKAGGAYVPLDSAYPVQRLAYMLSDAQVAVLLTQEKLLSQLPANPAAGLVCLDRDWQTMSRESKHNPSSGVRPENLAYVIYTSGSTGLPKGVLIGHRGLCNLAVAQIKIFNTRQSSRVLQLASLSFDASIWEIVMALASGATLCLGRAGTLLAGEELLQTLEANAITHATMSPSALASLPQQKLPSLQTLIVAGEACPGALVEIWSSGRRFFNAYGPTESTVCATVAECSPCQQKPPIGKPIQNISLYILDKYMQPVPIGVAGELHIGGDGLARGYLNRPELTQEKFIPHPFSDDRNARLYKTGDLCRYLANGNIEYLGRIDHQVKLRGFRIEIGEIEIILCQNPNIHEAIVILREDTPEDKKLVAYLVGGQVSTGELRQYLQSKLPEYMIPSHFVWLEALPLTPNGKIDRRALPVPQVEKRLIEILQPQTPTQEILSNLWKEVLKVPEISRTDNFFELGGHSLLATQLISRIRSNFAINLPVKTLFENPTLEQLAYLIEQTRQGKTNHDLTPIKPLSSREDFPLSFAQERLWFLDQLESHRSNSYNIPVAVQLEGNLNREAVRKAFQTMIERHEVLRTAIVTQAGEPRQVIAKELLWQIPEIDLKHLDEEARLAQLQELLDEEAGRPFDLSQSPLMRSQLVQLDNDRYVLQVTLHHIISDGWSMEVFFREWSSLYEAFAQEQQYLLPPLTIQYADFAVWQREWLRGEVLEQQLNYWKQQLADAPPLLELPTDYPRPALKSSCGQSLDFYLSQQLKEELKSLSQKAGATLFMTLLAAFAILLMRYSRQEDIVIGSPIANRNRSEIEPLIGFFVNTLALRTNLAGNPSFAEVLQQVREVTLDAYAHQDLPFEKLVEELKIERSLSHSPLFQVMFTWQNLSGESWDLSGLKVTPLAIEAQAAKFDLTLTLEETEQGLRGSWTYNTDLFKPETIERMGKHWQNLLEAILANPQTKIGVLSLLAPAERHQLLVEWNNTARDYPKDKCIQHLFEEQVQKTPDAVALVYEEQSLTYAQLNEQANQLAHYLQGLGVKPETLVGLYLERSLAMIVGLLGILKAGGAYVPLDPAYPSARVAYMLSDAGVSVLLTQESLLSELPPCEAKLVCLDRDWTAIARQSVTNPSSGVIPENLVYIIYTSGSTGKPKGVMIEHRQILNYLYGILERFDFAAGSSFANISTLAADLGNTTIFPSLCTGGQLHILSWDRATNPDAFSDYLSKNPIDYLKIVPSHLAALQNPCQMQQILPRRALILGGEPSRSEWVKSLLDIGQSEVTIYNHYGPTETTVGVLTYRLESPQLLSENQSLPLGRPLGNVQIYLLDPHLNPVPIGIPGEVYIGGPGLGRGYLNQPELTQEKFIPNPYSSCAGERIYKTGDLALYLGDGNIKYLGRIDNQVKLRGFRIELGEIESILTQHDSIREALVIVRENNPGNKKLIAYLVGNQISTSELRPYLQAKLPDYMIPSQLVWLEALPLTANGKIDRRTLPEPDMSNSQIHADSVPPRDYIERQLTNIWSDILEISSIGIYDNFFELGGHSLLAVKLMARIQQNFGRNLPLATLFQSPTVESLAKILRAEAASMSWSPLVPIQPKGSKPPFFCVPGAGGNVIYFHHLARYLGPDRPFYGLQAQGLDGKSEPHAEVEVMAKCYIEAIQQVQPQGPYLLGGHSFGGWVAFEMAQQLIKQGESVDLVAVLDGWAPLNNPHGEYPDRHEIQWLSNLAYLFEHWYGLDLGFSPRELTYMTPEDQLDYLKQKLQNAAILPPDTDIDRVRGLVNVFKANCCTRYAPQDIYRAPIVLIKAESNPVEEELEEKPTAMPEEPTWGWHQLSQGTVEIYTVPGDHITMMCEPHVQVLAKRLSICLKKATTKYVNLN